jgi:hypothetical protein
MNAFEFWPYNGASLLRDDDPGSVYSDFLILVVLVLEGRGAFT